MTHPRQWNYAFLRVNPSNSGMEDILAFVEETWKEFSPEYPFEYQFLDNRLDRLYRTEQRVGRIVLYFTCLTIFIASLGLFGLASFTAEQRTKEIGVRKVLGASVPGIVIMLSREFTRWVILASIIAWPVAYIVMNRWLRSFAYRIDLRLEIFVVSTAIALVVTLFTVSTQSIRAAIANPADSLKYE
jgi:putative ABC transport system permease protein